MNPDPNAPNASLSQLSAVLVAEAKRTPFLPIRVGKQLAKDMAKAAMLVFQRHRLSRMRQLNAMRVQDL